MQLVAGACVQVAVAELPLTRPPVCLDLTDWPTISQPYSQSEESFVFSWPVTSHASPKARCDGSCRSDVTGDVVSLSRAVGIHNRLSSSFFLTSPIYRQTATSKQRCSRSWNVSDSFVIEILILRLCSFS